MIIFKRIAVVFLLAVLILIIGFIIYAAVEYSKEQKKAAEYEEQGLDWDFWIGDTPFEDIEPGDDEIDYSELVGYTYVSNDEKISFTFLENGAVYTSYGTMQELKLTKVEGIKLSYEKDGIEYNFVMGYHPFLLCDFTEHKFLQVQVPEDEDG